MKRFKNFLTKILLRLLKALGYMEPKPIYNPPPGHFLVSKKNLHELYMEKQKEELFLIKQAILKVSTGYKHGIINDIDVHWLQFTVNTFFRNFGTTAGVEVFIDWLKKHEKEFDNPPLIEAMVILLNFKKGENVT